MKKSAIALAVASSLAASAVVQAETTFYGRAALSIIHTDNDLKADDVNSPGDVKKILNDGDWDIISSGSRWGVKGSEDLGNGLSAIYHIETAIPADSYNGGAQKGRLAWVGLKGGFGAVKIGAQWSPYYNTLGAADIFNEAGWYSYYQGPFRLNNTLLYETPGSISAVKGEVALVMNLEEDGNGNKTEDKSIDLYSVGLSGNFGPAYVGVGYQSNEVTDGDQWGIAASFDFAGASIAAMYEDYDFSDGGGAEGKDYYLTAQYTLGNNILRAGWGRNDPKNGKETDEWAVGFQHNLSKRTRVWVEYADDEAAGGSKSDGESQLTLGLRHDF